MNKFDLSNFMLEAEKLKEHFEKSQEKARNTKVTGESGAGLVKVIMNGTYDVISTHLDDSILEQPKNIIEELITSAANDATRKVNDCNKNNMSMFSELFNMQPPR